MSLETAGSSETASESVSAESPVAASTSGSGYSKVDPGYESFEIGESTEEETTPSETLDDASSSNAAEETAETPTEVEAVDSEEISDELLDRALDLGYTKDELKSFSDAKALEKEVNRVERLNQRLQERQGNKPAAEAAPVIEAEPEPNWAELIDLGHDPDAIALQKRIWERAQRAESQVQQLMQVEQDRALTAQSERFDDTLNKMEGFEKILGTGRKSELEKASPEHVANRQQVFTTMQILKRGFEEAGVKIPSEEKLIKAAAMASFPDHTEQTARQKLTSDIKKAGSQALSRPRSSGAKPLSGPALAEAKEAEFWRKRQ